MLRRQSLQRQPPTTPQVLAYVHEFKFTHSRATHNDLGFYGAERVYTSQGDPKGYIIPLDSIVQPCPLTPRFGKKADELGVLNDNCLEKCNKFWINSFHTQHTYQSVY